MTFAQFASDSIAFGALCVMASIVGGLFLALVTDSEPYTSAESIRIENEAQAAALELAEKRHALVIAAFATDVKGE